MYYEYNSEYEYCGDDFFDFEFVEPIKLSDINYMDIETVNGNLYYDTKNISDINPFSMPLNVNDELWIAFIMYCPSVRVIP